ncbi:receptor-like protein kinase, partial [Trifolium medium]|nr:receptor-like protein kinase [Trifolium medium]
MPKFMHPFIEDIIDVKGDGYCGYGAVCLYNKGTEEDFELLRLNMKRELSLHKELYVKLFGGEDRLTYITDALFPPPRKSRHAVAPRDKWFTYPDMGFVVATLLERVVVLLSKVDRSGGSNTCFPLRGIPPSDLSDMSTKILCIGALPDHFVLVKLKQGC